MTIDTQTVAELEASLTGALGASRDFEPLLEAERDALKNADLPTLSDIVERKKVQTETLLTASQRLLTWCEAQAIDPDYAAFEAWSRAMPSGQAHALQGRWRELRQSLDRNNRASTVNRQILATLTARNQAKLSLFKNLLGAPDTYSATGNRVSGPIGGWVDRV